MSTEEKTPVLRERLNKSPNCFEGIIFGPGNLLELREDLMLAISSLLDKVYLENVLLISKFINTLLPPAFNNWFTFCSNVQTIRQLYLLLVNFLNPLFHTNLYGKNSIKVSAIDAWNKAQISLGDTILKDLTVNEIKAIIMKRMIDSY